MYYYLLLPLQRFMSESLIRVSGRFSNSSFSLHSKHQVIIDKNHPLASLFITYIHERNFHCGGESTLSLLRKKYWIIYKKALLRNVPSNCSRCKRLTIQPNAPMMGNLTCERLSIRKHPLSCTGVDFFGPLFVKIGKGTRISSGTEKRFGVIFTCLTTRACYIDLAGTSSTDSFLLAFRRSTSRRGKPRLIRSNNGSKLCGS